MSEFTDEKDAPGGPPRGEAQAEEGARDAAGRIGRQIRHDKKDCTFPVGFPVHLERTGAAEEGEHGDDRDGEPDGQEGRGRVAADDQAGDRRKK